MCKTKQIRSPQRQGKAASKTNILEKQNIMALQTPLSSAVRKRNYSAALDVTTPLTSFYGKKWTHYFDAKTIAVLKQQHKTIDNSMNRDYKSNAYKCTVMKLNRSGMNCFGQAPNTYRLPLVICEVCDGVVKATGLERHMRAHHRDSLREILAAIESASERRITRSLARCIADCAKPSPKCRVPICTLKTETKSYSKTI